MNYSVLIVDDDPMARQLLQFMLRRANFVLDEAENGYIALEKVKNNRPDVMILDVMMPGMSGLEVCQKLRAAADTADLPIIMLSARTSYEAVQEGLAVGANEYLLKPTRSAELINSIQTLLAEASVSQAV